MDGISEPSEGSEPDPGGTPKDVSAKYRIYRRQPVRYCQRELTVKLTPAQTEIARLLVKPPYKVLVRAGHNVGKSFLAACMVNWWFDSFDPGVCLTTAPTDRQVKDILWKEVRALRTRRKSQLPKDVFPGPKACRMESSPEHFAHGFTARDGDRFQGQHSVAVLIVFDEAEGVAPIFWEAAEAMLGGRRFRLSGIYNPTAQGGPTADAERSGRYHLVTMSALDHPNIAAELLGKPRRARRPSGWVDCGRCWSSGPHRLLRPIRREPSAWATVATCPVRLPVPGCLAYDPRLASTPSGRNGFLTRRLSACCRKRGRCKSAATWPATGTTSPPSTFAAAGYRCITRRPTAGALPTRSNA